PQGDRLMVRTNQDRVANNQRISSDLEITLPRGLAVESRGSAGDFEITDINGDVDLSGHRGDMRLTRLGGNARLDIGRSELIRALHGKGRIELVGHGADVE